MTFRFAIKKYPQHAIASHSCQAAGFTEIILRAINSYGLYEGCAHWLIRACVVPLALNHTVRVEFLNLGGIVSVARLLELHTSSRDLAAAVLKATDHLLDHPQLKIEIKKKVHSCYGALPICLRTFDAPLQSLRFSYDDNSQGELIMRIRNIPKVFSSDVFVFFLIVLNNNIGESFCRMLKDSRRRHMPYTILASKS